MVLALLERLCVVRFEGATACVCALLAQASLAAAWSEAVSVEYEAERECPTALAMERALANATVYRQVYVWAHARDVREWTYERTTASAELVVGSWTRRWRMMPQSRSVQLRQ